MDSTLSYAAPPLKKSSRNRGAVSRAGESAASVVTCMKFDASVETVWERLRFYEQIEKRPPLVLRLLLPIPIRTQGRQLEAGNEIKCVYQDGYLVKRVTRITPGWNYSFEVVEQNLPLRRGIKLSGGSYTLRKLPGGATEVALETRYASPNRPRWFCRWIEAMVCHLFHRHILTAMRRGAELN
jgi:hypothetical protein